MKKLTFKIWLWLIVFFLSIVSIFVTPYLFKSGVLIKSVDANSAEFKEGLRQGQIIRSIDGQTIKNINDYSKIVSQKFSSNETIKITIETNEQEYTFLANSLNLVVSNLPKTNIRMGLDLSGGARALVQAENHKLTKEEAETLAQVLNNKFNVYGISDISVRSVSDLNNDYFIQIEIAGATPKELESLVSQQGKFEGKIGNNTIFFGGNQDIKNVVKSGQSVGVYQCNQYSSGYVCSFRFPIVISQEAAERMAEATKSLSVVSHSNGESFLSQPLDLYLDDKFYTNLSIAAGLKGSSVTQISIQGSGTGVTQDDAIKSAQQEMKNLQTVLQTGSLPFRLKVVKLDTISPTLGEGFTKYILITGVLALLSVVVIIFIKYKDFKTVLLPLIICTSEIIITLGVAAFIQWDLDLASIAGILTAIGTGIDDQIVVLDETKNKKGLGSIKEKIKRAFVIVFGAYFTTVASLLPLWKAGAGLLKGFVFTTLIGVTIGVVITRPAFADLVKLTEKE